MLFSSVLRRLQGTRKASPRSRPMPAPRRRLRPPAVEELEPRLTPAEVGLNDFRLSFMGNDGYPNFDASNSAVAYNSRNHEYLVVWSGDDFTDNEFEIFGQRIDAATGALLGGDIRLSDLGPDGNPNFGAFFPAVAYNGVNNEYLVVWHGDDTTNDEFEIFGQRLDAATGVEVGANDFRISDLGPDNNTSYAALGAAVAYNGTNNQYLVVWHGDDDTAPLVNDEFEIFGQRLEAATGTQTGVNDFRISDMGPDGNINFRAFAPAVAYNGAANEYLVVWEGDDIIDNETEIYGQRINAATGAEAGANDFRLSEMGPEGNTSFAANSPAVAFNSVNNEYLVVWHGDDTTDDEFEIFGQRLEAATGAQIGVTDFRLSDMGPEGNANFGASSAAVAYNGAANEYLVVWEGDDNTVPLVDNKFEIFGQRLEAATGAQVGVNDFRLSDMGPDGNTNFGAGSPAVASSGASNEVLVVWAGDDTTVNESEIFGQRFAPLDPPPPLPPPPPSPPLPPPPEPPQIAVVAFRQKGRAKVRVTDAASGTVRAVLTPFKGYRGRLAVQLRDLNGDGSLDLVVQAAVRGRRKQMAYDAVTLAPLPPNLL